MSNLNRRIGGGDRIKTIDVHAHVIALQGPKTEKKYRDALPYLSRDSTGREVVMVRGQPSQSVPEQLYNIELRIRDMDKTHVDVQALSASPFYTYCDADPRLRIEYSRVQNDAIADVIRNYPDRFVGLATVPLQDPLAASKELERAMKELGMRGAEITNEITGKNLDWPQLWPFYEKAQELGAFVLYHPQAGAIPGAEMMPKFHFQNLVGNAFTTTLAIASMIFGGVLKDFPKLKFCFAHAGGFAPYQIGRLDHGFYVRPECKEFIANPPSEYFKLLFCDTITHYLPALEYLIKIVGVDKVLLGSDYPFDMGDPEPVAMVNRLESVSLEEKRRILSENAAKLLGINVA